MVQTFHIKFILCLGILSHTLQSRVAILPSYKKVMPKFCQPKFERNFDCFKHMKYFYINLIKSKKFL